MKKSAILKEKRNYFMYILICALKAVKKDDNQALSLPVTLLLSVFLQDRLRFKAASFHKKGNIKQDV